MRSKQGARVAAVLAAVPFVFIVSAGDAGGQVELPDVPQVTVPSVTVPSVTPPEVKTPSTPVPVPKVEVPQVKTPQVQTPEVRTPGVRTPDVPGVKVPGVNVPGVTGGGSGSGTTGSVPGAVPGAGAAGATSLASPAATAAAFGGANGVVDTPAERRRVRAARQEIRFQKSARKLDDCLYAVHGLERRVIVLRTGLGDAKPLSRKRVARRLGISPRRVRTLERRAIHGLREADKTFGCGTGGSTVVVDQTMSGVTEAALASAPELESTDVMASRVELADRKAGKRPQGEVLGARADSSDGSKAPRKVTRAATGSVDEASGLPLALLLAVLAGLLATGALLLLRRRRQPAYSPVAETQAQFVAVPFKEAVERREREAPKAAEPEPHVEPEPTPEPEAQASEPEPDPAPEPQPTPQPEPAPQEDQPEFLRARRPHTKAQEVAGQVAASLSRFRRRR